MCDGMWEALLAAVSACRLAMTASTQSCASAMQGAASPDKCAVQTNVQSREMCSPGKCAVQTNVQHTQGLVHPNGGNCMNSLWAPPCMHIWQIVYAPV